MHEHVHTRGIRLHVEHVGSGPLVVLLADASATAARFSPVLPDLAGAGFQAAALDARGQGDSDKPPYGYELRVQAGDVAGTITALGHDDALIIGEGSAAALAWAVGAFYPQRCRGVIAINGGFRVWPKVKVSVPVLLAHDGRHRWQLLTQAAQHRALGPFGSTVCGAQPDYLALIRQHSDLC